MEKSNFDQGTRVAIGGLAFMGSIASSLLIGILGILYTFIAYPNSEFEHGAAVVGALCGSPLSIPIGILGVSTFGTIFLHSLLRRNKPHPALLASIGAFVIGALASGASLAPIGFLFYVIGHI